MSFPSLASPIAVRSAGVDAGAAGFCGLSSTSAGAKADTHKVVVASAPDTTSSSAVRFCVTPKPPLGTAHDHASPPTGAAHAGARRSADYIGTTPKMWNPRVGEQVMVFGQKKGEPFRKRDVATVVRVNDDETFDLVYVIGSRKLKGLNANDDFEKYTPRQGRTRLQASLPK